MSVVSTSIDAVPFVLPRCGASQTFELPVMRISRATRTGASGFAYISVMASHLFTSLNHFDERHSSRRSTGLKNAPSTLDQIIIALASFSRNRYLPFSVPNSEVFCEKKRHFEGSGRDVYTVVPCEIRTDSTSEMESIANISIDRLVCTFHVRKSCHGSETKPPRLVVPRDRVPPFPIHNRLGDGTLELSPATR